MALQNRCAEAGIKLEWGDILRDFDRLQQATIENGGKTWSIRTEATGTLLSLLKALRIAANTPRSAYRAAARPTPNPTAKTPQTTA